jgi:Iron-containing redox enzyme
MSTFDPLLSNAQEFEATVTEEIQRFKEARLIQLLLAGKLQRSHYHEILLTIFPQSYHGPYTMALAAARCPWRHEEVKEYLLNHAQEEASHWRWIIEDLRSTGYEGTDPRELHAHPSCESYVSFAERVSEQAPYARLAISSVLEGLAAEFGESYGQALLSQLAISPKQAQFFVNHGITDKTHINEIKDVIARCRFTPEEWGWMRHTARVAGSFYRAMYDHEGYPPAAS